MIATSSLRQLYYIAFCGVRNLALTPGRADPAGHLQLRLLQGVVGVRLTVSIWEMLVLDGVIKENHGHKSMIVR